jgi:hypothetical protein
MTISRACGEQLPKKISLHLQLHYTHPRRDINQLSLLKYFICIYILKDTDIKFHKFQEFTCTQKKIPIPLSRNTNDTEFL